MTELPLIARARLHGQASMALCTDTRTFSYQNLLDRSEMLAAALLGDSADLNERRIALIAPAGFAYVAAQWAIWRAGGIKVPISFSSARAGVGVCAHGFGAWTP